MQTSWQWLGFFRDHLKFDQADDSVDIGRKGIFEKII